MKIAHEAPLFLYEESRTFNDYDHAIVPLFNQDEEYYEFFVESLKQGREVILDNESTIEPLDVVDFVGWIRKLYKDAKIGEDSNLTYIIPNIQNDADGSLRSAKEFFRRFKKIPARPLAVIQGMTFIELFKNYHDMYPLADKIGIPSNSPAYETFFDVLKPDIPQLEKWTQGREVFIEELFHAGWMTKEKPLHLYDAAYPDEFGYYTHHHSELATFFETANTADPIVQGMNAVEYSPLIDARKKEAANFLYVTKEKESKNVRIVRQNIKMFRTINFLPPRIEARVASNNLANFLIPADGRRT
jgi:hypothetical protein